MAWFIAVFTMLTGYLVFKKNTSRCRSILNRICPHHRVSQSNPPVSLFRFKQPSEHPEPVHLPPSNLNFNTNSWNIRSTPLSFCKGTLLLILIMLATTGLALGLYKLYKFRQRRRAKKIGGQETQH